MAAIEVKRISSSCQTRTRVTVSVYEKNANYCLRICTKSTQRFACLYDMEALRMRVVQYKVTFE